MSSFDGYVCPEFGEEIRIVNGIHPLLERNVRNDFAVPNNIVNFIIEKNYILFMYLVYYVIQLNIFFFFFSFFYHYFVIQIATPDFNFFLITGPNMSGKTIYLKMIAILQIMAQVDMNSLLFHFCLLFFPKLK